MFEISRAEPDDWKLVRAVRLKALQDAPDWFWATYEDEAGRPEAWWRDYIGAGAWFVAWKTDEPVGIAAAIYDESLGPAKRQLISMWVTPASRGEGIGAALVDRVKEWASETGIRTLQLEVTETNDAARRLYERCGFRATGRTAPHPRVPRLSELEMEADLRG